METNKQDKIEYFLYARKSSESEDKQVASIPSQIEELTKLAKKLNITIRKVFREEQSAKAPGRPFFNAMIQEIQKGKAQGIICWKLDRLTRNQIDGGKISWMLQQGEIKHIQTYERAYCPADNVLLMNLEIGMAVQFIRELTLNTKRGLENKVNNGWLPRKPPLGYKNNTYAPEKDPIFRDPDKFDLVRKLWDILLEKKYSMKKMKEVADNIGLRTHRGKTLAVSKIHGILTNPFYFGHFRWHDTLHEGKHEPMITKKEFDMAQNIINGRLKSREKYLDFAYTGLIRCGECGASITAEYKIKKQKNGNTHHYRYYHCTKKVDPNCSQKPIREDRMEEQIKEKIGQISIPPEFHQWAIKYLSEEQAKEVQDRELIRQSQQRAQSVCSKKLDALLELRLNGEIEADEYQRRKEGLIKEKRTLEELMADTNQREETWLDRAEQLLSFAEMAQIRFQTGDLETKRQILSLLGSNLSFKDGFLRINLTEPLKLVEKFSPGVQALHKRLEPTKKAMGQADWEVLYTKHKKWGDQRDLNPQPQGPQPCALTN